jgi:hypothetical protein
MTKFKDCIAPEFKKKLDEARETMKPVINLYNYPRGERFIQVRIKYPGDDFWPLMVGRTCKVKVRGVYKYDATLTSCTFKKLDELTEEDASMAGYSGEDALDRFTANLTRHMNQNPRWMGGLTELEILGLKRI